MSVTESQLREQYRNSSDEQLLFLAQQGSSEYTDRAWALLREEVTRRGLSLMPAAQPSSVAAPATEDIAAVPLPLARWGEVQDADTGEFLEALADEELSKDAGGEPAPPAHDVNALTFTGHGGEYFRIWLVNLFFKVVTLGLYSPWAKVRKARYFRQNTRLDGHVFDYHGNPVAILRGRLVAVVLLAAYMWAFQFSNTAGLLTAAALCAVAPWLFMRAQQFTLTNTSFRGLRFGFRARTGETYRALLPVLALWLAPSVVPALGIDERWLFGAPTLALPWMHHRLKAYQRRNAAYGELEFTFTPATGRFYAIYAKGLVFLFVGAILAAVVFGSFTAWQERSSWAIGSSKLAVLIATGVAALIVYVTAGPYYAARLQQVMWGRTQLGDIRFRTEIRALPLFRLVVKNVALTIITAGLYWPWAAIAVARYRIECVLVESAGPLSALAGGLHAGVVPATGEGATDTFGIDIGL